MTVNYIRNVTLYLILLQIYFNVTYYTLNIEMSDFGSLNWNLNMSAIFEILGILISGNIIINFILFIKIFLSLYKITFYKSVIIVKMFNTCLCIMYFNTLYNEYICIAYFILCNMFN